MLESVQLDFKLKVISFAQFEKLGSKLSNDKRRRLNEERGKVVLATSFRSRYVEKKGGKKERNM